MDKYKMDKYPIDREAFRAWLGANFRNEVGRAVRACDCPLVNYIKTLEPPATEIRTGGLDLVTRDGVWLLPDWAKFFIMKIDNHNYNAPITGQAALGVLEAIQDD